jgi:alanine racemase
MLRRRPSGVRPTRAGCVTTRTRGPLSRDNACVTRSLVTIDLAAIRHNASRLREIVGQTEVWAVVKADAYGHGAAEVGPAAVAGGVTALCVATVGEGLQLRPYVGAARIVVLGPTYPDELPAAREAGLELTVASDGPLPDGVPLHLKLDTGMGRWGLSELPSPDANVVGLMTHFASSESDREFTALQLEQFMQATEPYAHLVRHAANSAAAIGVPASRLDAVRCGIAIYGIDPFGEDARRHGLRPALRWESEVVRVVDLAPGQSTGYGRTFVASDPVRIGVVPVGYADGFSRDLSGTDVLVDGSRARVVGTISMDALAVLLPPGSGTGAAVTLVGEGVTLEEHARVAGTIAYELACGIRTAPSRSVRMVVG